MSVFVQDVLTVTAKEEAEIKKSYGKSEKEIDEDLVALKDWLEKSPHLPKYEEDCILKRILYFNKFSLEKTKQKLDLYYSGQNLLPEFFENRNPLHPSMQKIFEYCTIVPIPTLTKDFCRITVSKLVMYDSPDYDGWEYFKFLLAGYEVRLRYDFYIADILLIDLSNTSFKNMLKVPPTCIIKAFNALLKTYSDRLRGLHVIHAAPYTYASIELVKKIISSKLGERVHVHYNLKSLFEYIPKEFLPEDYGGSQKSLFELHNQWKEFMESQDAWMLDRAKMKSDEKLRTGQSIDPGLFGVEGSFRQLNID